MELYQLNTFAVVAKTSNVTRAAELLNTTPPSVSNHIRQIEEELDIKLFTRTPKGMFITSQGEQLLDKVNHILQSTQDLKDLAIELKSNVKGKVSLGINSAPEYLKIPEIIDQNIMEFPDIKLEIVPSSTGLILDGIEQGSMDCGFAFGPLKENGIHAIHLSGVDLIIAIPQKFKKDYQKAPIEALTGLPWLVPENRCPFLKRVQDHLNNLGLTLEDKVFANDDITKQTLVNKGVAVCVLEQSEAQPFIQDKIIVPWNGKGKGKDRFESSLSFVYPNRRCNDVLISAMVSIIKKVWKVENQDQASY